MEQAQRVGHRVSDVVLEYQLRLEDMTEAVRLLFRKRGRAGFIHQPVFLAAVMVVGVLVLTAGLAGGDGIGFAFGGALMLWPLLMLRVPAMTARQLLRANQHHGVMRVTVAEEGVRTVSAHMDSRMSWANYGSYAETDHCFVLRSPDRIGACAMVIVKQGAPTPQDVDRLRALLNTKLPRV
ncbi:YcxB family protein [Streptomyces sp. NPDC101455]|uniref:YcxB family protein n=1 Tax=Streptomyces sp. NPDC101455 TaxID=3366142 RepID=UPI003827649E